MRINTGFGLYFGLISNTESLAIIIQPSKLEMQNHYKQHPSEMELRLAAVGRLFLAAFRSTSLAIRLCR
jgi:hypothetical protein